MCSQPVCSSRHRAPRRPTRSRKDTFCEPLWEQKAAHAPPGMEEQRAIGLLKGDPRMRAVFIKKIAPPIADKMRDHLLPQRRSPLLLVRPRARAASREPTSRPKSRASSAAHDPSIQMHLVPRRREARIRV